MPHRRVPNGQDLAGLDLDVRCLALEAAQKKASAPEETAGESLPEGVRSITDTISGRVDFEGGRILLPNLNLTEDFAQQIEKIVIIACGTASYAAMIGKVLIEKIARIPVEVDIASEFRYRDPLVNERQVVLVISQSGETADTLAAMPWC